MGKYVFLRLSTVFILGTVSVCSAMEGSPPDIKTGYKRFKRTNSEAFYRGLSEEKRASLDSNPNSKNLAKTLDFTSEKEFFPQALRRKISGLQPQPPQRNLSTESSDSAGGEGASSVSGALQDLSLSPKK